ncbi:pericentrin isoform X5 [Manis javanica]|uniref:pericentrin isoform X5 n=1 Tax=Manis javanica TaxID=9974 RepID=UPI003C6DB04D
MEEDEQEQRRRKVEAGRAKLAHFRQRKTKGDCAHSKKKPAKRLGPTVHATVRVAGQEASLVAAEDGGLLGRGDICRSPSCSHTPSEAGAAQEHEQEHKPEIVGLLSRQRDEIGGQQQAVDGQLQTQPVSSLELEALRLSLSDAHAAQLELTQANLQREKEAALTELRELLRGRHAQELALLRSRQRRELELAREEVAHRCSQETAELKEKLRSEVEKNVQMVETLKQNWESEKEVCLENLRKELLEKHQSELENLQSQWKRGLAEQKAELENTLQARNQAESSPKALEAPQEAAVCKLHLHEDLQTEHGQQVDDLELKFREKQLELENLQASYEELKAQSQGEIRRLWSQLESTRTSRQELSELHEQLLARVSHVEELEQLKQDFEQQQRREKAEHESQLEQLRLCFEEKLRDAEENYQEDVTLLQQRLREMKEDCLLEPAGSCSSRGFLEESSERGRTGHLGRLNLLEQHEVKHDLVEDHQEELKKAKEKIQLMKEEFREREAEWKATSEASKREAEEKLTLMLRDLREQAESEKESIVNRFELRETEMRQLQDRQAAQILDLEGSLKEQQGRLRQLELGLAGDESPQCSHCGREPGGGLASAHHDRELTVLHLKEDCALQLMLAQSRFLEERKEITEKFTAEQDAVLREAQETHASELRLLQGKHQQHVLSLTMELETRHQAEVEALKASFESEQRALLEARVAELQTEHAAEISALETRHLSHLDSLESCYLSEIQGIRDEHRRALELLQSDLEKQLYRKGPPCPATLTGEVEHLQQEPDGELPPAKHGPSLEVSAECGDGREARQGGLVPTEAEAQCPVLLATLEKEKQQTDHQEETGLLKCQAEALPGQQITPLKLKDPILSISHELEERRSELEQPQQRHEGESREGSQLLWLLRADLDRAHLERRALQEGLRRLLDLFGEVLKAAAALKSRIGEQVGLCLEDEASAVPMLEDTWPGSEAALLDLERTLPECAEMSSVAEISSHVCESFLMNPGSMLECEQTVRRAHQSLGRAVDRLLEMVLASTRQLEEARQIHCRFEKEFSCKNEETAQVVRKHQELLECLDKENEAKTRLTLELHKAGGIVEGLKVERASLQEALGRKEMSEQCLVAELESLKQRLWQAAQQQAALGAENTALRSREEAWAAGAAREAGTPGTVAHRDSALRREVECLTKEHTETRQQSEKDRSALLSQMKVLEAELEEQLARHQACARQAEELCALRQQMESLDKHLRSQRQFMDEQAAEREREREEFQQEIQRLQGQPQGPHHGPLQQAPLDEEVEVLQEKLREKSEGLNELLRKNQLADRQVLMQEEEIKRLEETNADSRRQVVQLQEELERQRRALQESEQEKEALQEQQLSKVPLMSTLQSELDGGPVGGLSEHPDGELEAMRGALLQPEGEAFLQNKEKEIMCMREQLAGMGSSVLSEVMCNRSSEVEELKSIIENLQENQERLQKDKAEEIEQLHEVIERLQRELFLGGPVVHEVSDCQAENLRSELEQGLLCLRSEGAEAHAALEGELQAALAAKEAMSRLLAEQECRHSQALGALRERLQGVEDAASQQLAELGCSVSLREAEVQGMASQIQEFEAALKAKEAKISERDLEIDTMKKQKLAHSIELGTVLLSFAHLCRNLEQQPLNEPPELQWLQVQCVRLSHQLQVLSQRFLGCQKEMDKQQACRAHVEGSSQGQVPRGEEASCDEESGQEGKGNLLEDCQLQKADLITQVKQLQERLDCLVHSQSLQSFETEGFKCQQPLAFWHVLENSSSDSSNNGDEADNSPPVDALNIHETLWDPVDVTGNPNSVISEEPGAPGEDEVDLQNGSLCLQVSLPGSSGGSSHSEGTEPLKTTLRAVDLSSWSSPEVVRKDWTLEPPPSLPLTPCSDALSQCSLDATLQDRIDALLLPSDQSQALCYPGRSASRKAPGWAASLLATVRAPFADQHVQWTAVEKDVEDAIITSLDSQQKSASSPGLAGRPGGSAVRDGLGFGEILNRGSGGLGAPTAGPAVPLPASGRFQQPVETMKEKEVHPQQVKALLQMVCDESRHILALSECCTPASAPSEGKPHMVLECILREAQGLLEAVPQKGEKEPPDVSLTWRREFLQGAQQVFGTEQDTLPAKLWPWICSSDPGDPGSLQPRRQQMVWGREKPSEHLPLSDRSSLLGEIQALRAQLRMTHLQNQEKLQQLCAALTSAQAHGSQQERQLRRQVELLAYKVEQEKCIASNLQKTLGEEQERASDAQKLLVVEQKAVRDLRSELCECKEDNERLLASLHSTQKEVLQLRSTLDSKENSLQAALQELEGGRGKERALQSRLEEEQLQRLQSEAQSTKALEELRKSLEQECAQGERLRVALEHERTARDNLQKELRIESSRCEALLAQERGRLSELQRSLAAEEGRSLELSEALHHERLLTEQLSRRTQEARTPHSLGWELKGLRAALEAARQQEAQAQRRCEELRREKERELELQCQRDEHRIRQLQRTVRDLQASVEARASPDSERIREQQQGLEKTRQQLLWVAGLLTSFISQAVDRTINDWTSSNEKAVASLLRTLEELKSELSATDSSQKEMTAELQVRLVDTLLQDNDSLRRRLGAGSRGKAGLRGAASRPKETLQAIRRPDRTAPRSPWHPEPGRSTPAASEEASASSIKMEKLYLHYLRAESFRKALIYQKKYLLLLIGGFQDSEQETLSMIAHLGVFPSKADKKTATSRPLTKFRTAVRVVTATLRLRFLVKKWQEVDRKGALVLSRASRPGFLMPQRQLSPPKTSKSPPTRDVSPSHARGPVPRASPRRRERADPSLNSRSERSLTASQDPERSLTEYIKHLETIQQRLGVVPPDFTSKQSCHQKIKQ